MRSPVRTFLFQIAIPTMICLLPASAAARIVGGGFKAGFSLSYCTGEFLDDLFGLEQQDGMAILPSMWLGGGYSLAVYLAKWSYVEIDLMYARKGVSASRDSSGVFGDGSGEVPHNRYELQTDWIEMPLVATLISSKDKLISPYLYAGPSVSVLVRSAAYRSLEYESRSEIVKYNTYSRCRPYNIGVAAGAGLKFGLGLIRFNFDMRMTADLLDTYRPETVDGGPAGDIGLRNIYLISMLGYEIVM